MENGYSICFNEWALDKEIKNELGLLLIISSLTAEKGYCYASNQYLGELFNEPEHTISRKIKKLEAKGYITIEYEKRGCEITNRKIRLTKMVIDDYQKCGPTITKNVEENNISNNITSIKNIEKENIKKKKFTPPTLEEVETYIEENNLTVNAKDFVDYFEATGWVDARGQKVVSWKGKLRTWQKFQPQNKTRQKSESSTSNPFLKLMMEEENDTKRDDGNIGDNKNIISEVLSDYTIE